MAFVWMVISGLAAALSNLCMRRSMDIKGSARVFFMFQLFLTFFILLLMHPIRVNNYELNLYILLMALACGISLGMMKWMISKALRRGPASLTFATVNSASVVPPLVIGGFFGTFFEFSFSTQNIVGSVLVVLGLFWATWNQQGYLQKRTWIIFVGLAFLLHSLFLILTQGHILLLKNEHLIYELFKKGSQNLASEWFMPLVFAFATIFHLSLYMITIRQIPQKTEIFWGLAGGVANGISAFFFMKGVEVASLDQQAFIFPVFSVMLILSCNIWGQWLYKEKVNWRANIVCLVGTVIGTNG